MQVIIRMNSLLSGFDVESPGTQHGLIPRGIELTIATRTAASSVSLHFRVLHPPYFLPVFCVNTCVRGCACRARAPRVDAAPEVDPSLSLVMTPRNLPSSSVTRGSERVH